MLDLLKELCESDYTAEGPQYLEFRYNFARSRNLAEFALQKCNVSHNDPIADEIKTHYARSNLFLLGTRSENFRDLADYWLLSDDIKHQRDHFMQRQAGIYNEETGRYRLCGNFQLMYQFFEMGILKSLIPSPGSNKPQVTNHHPCPNSFHIITFSDLTVYNLKTQEQETISPGQYYCKTNSGIVCPEGRYYQSIIEIDGEGTQKLISGHKIFSLCRKGEALVLVVTLSGLPTYVLDFHRPNWCIKWKALTETLYVSGFKAPRKRALVLAQKCIKHWNCPHYSIQNKWASWFFHDIYGTFPDEEMYEYYRSQI